MVSNRGEVGAYPDTIPTFSAAPVMYVSQKEGMPLPQWSPVPQSSIKELCKVQKEFKQENEYFCVLLKATLTASELTPADLRTLFSCLLTQTEVLLCEATWRREIQAVLPDLWADQNTAVDAEGQFLLIDHLCR